MKKLTAAVLSAIMLTMFAFCADTAPIKTPRGDGMSAMLTVTETGDGYIVGTTDEKRPLRLNVSSETVIIDAKTGASLSISDIAKGSVISAEYSENMTKSIPAQTNAYLIAVNVKKDAVNLVTVDEVETDKDGNVVVTDNTRDLVLRILKNARVLPYRTKNIVKASDIRVGDTLVAWYDVVTMSIPAQANTEKVVIVRSAEGAPSAWAKEDIDSAFSVGVAESLSSSWREDISRLDFCTLVYNALDKAKGMPRAKLAENPFDDVQNPKVNSLSFTGIVNGKGNKKFAPNDKITREEAAAVVFRAAKYAEVSAGTEKETAYKDFASVSDWARESVTGLSKLGIMKGDNNGNFAPKANYTSEQATVTALRLYNTIKK